MYEGLIVRDDELLAAIGAIGRTRHDFDAINGRCDDVSTAVGHARLGSVLEDFADNWRIRRERLGEDLQNLESQLSGIYETFTQTDIDSARKQDPGGRGSGTPGAAPTPGGSSTTPDAMPSRNAEAPPSVGQAPVAESGPVPDQHGGQAPEPRDDGTPPAVSREGTDEPDVGGSRGADAGDDSTMPQTPAFQALVGTLEDLVSAVKDNTTAVSFGLGGIAIAALAASGKLPEGVLASWLSSIRPSKGAPVAPGGPGRAWDLLVPPSAGEVPPTVGSSAVDGAAAAPVGPREADRRLSAVPGAQIPVGLTPGLAVGSEADRGDRGPDTGVVNGSVAAPPDGRKPPPRIEDPVIGEKPAVPPPIDGDTTGATASSASPDGGARDQSGSRTSTNASMLGMGAMSSMAAMQSAGAGNRPKADDHERLAEAKRLLAKSSGKEPTA